MCIDANKLKYIIILSIYFMQCVSYFFSIGNIPLNLILYVTMHDRFCKTRSLRSPIDILKEYNMIGSSLWSAYKMENI